MITAVSGKKCRRHTQRRRCRKILSGSLEKKGGKNATYCLIKDGTFFPLFCLTNAALLQQLPKSINVNLFQEVLTLILAASKL
jgi:hypothetical protein